MADAVIEAIDEAIEVLRRSVAPGDEVDDAVRALERLRALTVAARLGGLERARPVALAEALDALAALQETELAAADLIERAGERIADAPADPEVPA